MDPLSIVSAVASVVSIAQALGLGIRALRNMANASVEFCDMLNELTTLQGLLSQLHAITDDAAGTKLLGSPVTLDRLRQLELELRGLVREMDEMRAELSASQALPLPIGRKGGKCAVSRTKWHLARSKVIELRDRTRRCRDNLSACLGLLGFSQQLEQGMLVLEIRGILETSRQKMDQLCGGIHASSQTERSFIHSLSAHLDTRFDRLEAQLSSAVPSRRQRTANSYPSASSSPTSSIVGASTIHIQGFLREPCVKENCPCQCHRISTLSTPLWAEPLLGALILRYSGPFLFGASSCHVPMCRAQGRRSISIGYTFPTWLLARAVSLSACWGSLTNAGAWLHLVVPRVATPPGIWRAVMHGDLACIRQKIAAKEFLPTDIEATGEGYLSHILRYRRYDVVAFLLDMGFSPSFVDSSGGSAITIARMQLGFDVGLSPDVISLLHRIVAAEENWPPEGVPPAVNDSALDKIAITLKDASIAPPSLMNTLDEFGYAPLHWAAERGDMASATALLRAGAAVDIEAARHRKTPLHLAAFLGFAHMISLLLTNGADIHAFDFRRYTPLHCSIKHAASVRALLTSGANPNARSVTGATPLHLAASMSFGSHIETIYGLSVTSAAEPVSMPLSSTESEQYRKFHCSGLTLMEPNDGSGAVMADLVACGVDLDAQDYDGMTPVLCAAASGNVAAVRVLGRLGARLDAVARDGMTILDYAAVYGGRELTDCLRDLGVRGIDPDAPRAVFGEGNTAMGWLEERMAKPWLPGQTKPTNNDVFSFYALVFEMRERNWESGLFCESRERLEERGGHRALREWLGRQWQKLHDSPGFAESPAYDGFSLSSSDGSSGEDEHIVIMDLADSLFAGEMGEPGSDALSKPDGDGQVEEFFDALE